MRDEDLGRLAVRRRDGDAREMSMMKGSYDAEKD